MKKEEFLREIEKSLNSISAEERTEILYDYREHFMIGKANGKTEKEICLELGNPLDIASSYLLNRTTEPAKFHTEEGGKTNRYSISHQYRNSLLIVSCIVIGILLVSFAGYASITRSNTSSFKIDNSGIHGNGIIIDSNGVKVPGVTVNHNGVKAPGVSIDSNGINAPGVRIDNSGIKAPFVNIDNNGVKVPGVSIDNNGIKLPGITINNTGIKFNK
jgi:hypothetical protein